MPSAPMVAGSSSVSRSTAAAAAAAFLAGAFLAAVAFLAAGALRRRSPGRQRLGRRLLRRGRGGGLAGAGGGRDGARGVGTDLDRDAQATQVAQEGLEVAGLDLGVVTGLSEVVGGHAANGGASLDERDDGRVREHLCGEQLACVRGHEHLSSEDFGARQGPLSSSAAPSILPRPSPRPEPASPSARLGAILEWIPYTSARGEYLTKTTRSVRRDDSRLGWAPVVDP